MSPSEGAREADGRHEGRSAALALEFLVRDKREAGVPISSTRLLRIPIKLSRLANSLR